MTEKIVFPQNDEADTFFLHQDRKRPMETEIHTALLRSARPGPSVVNLMENCHRRAGDLRTLTL